MGSKPEFPHALAGVPGLRARRARGPKLLSRVQRGPHSLAQLPGVGHNSQVFWRLASQREESGAGSGARGTRSDPSAWRGRRAAG